MDLKKELLEYLLSDDYVVLDFIKDNMTKKDLLENVDITVDLDELIKMLDVDIDVDINVNFKIKKPLTGLENDYGNQ